MTGAPLRKGYADTPAGQVHYRHRPAAGDVSAGACPVLFLHQTASSGAMWAGVMARWTAGHPLFALDTPGFGGSFDPPDMPAMTDYAGWMAAAAAALGLDRYHLVGHHTGAGIALQMAVDLPARVASLAMIGASCLTADERAGFAARLGRPFRPNRSGAYLLHNWEYLRVGGADADVALIHREMTDQLRAWATRPQAYAAAWGQDGAALVARVTCPTTALAARDDLLFPSLARLAALRPDMARVVLAKGANFEPDLAPDEVTAALQAHVAMAERAR